MRKIRPLLAFACGVSALCLALGGLWLTPLFVSADEPADVSHATAAVRDPSVVLAYEDGNGKTYADLASAGEGAKKVYCVFGTGLTAERSYDLVNWTEWTEWSAGFRGGELYSMLRAEADYSRSDPQTLFENCRAPDVVWNPVMEKWCMYLSVSGGMQNSVIALLTADDLAGPWTRCGDAVWSRIGADNVDGTDYERVTGSRTVPPEYSASESSAADLIYGADAADPAVFFDGEKLWMAYGSQAGGIYLLELDPTTGLRNYERRYETVVDYAGGDPSEGIAAGNVFTVVSDEYFGIHIAGGHGCSGEGAYLKKSGEFYDLFLSYGGSAPDGGYNLRAFRSENVEGPYLDAGGRDARCASYENNADGSRGNRLITGYSWTWWGFSYLSEGHCSVFADGGKVYAAYQNRYADGSADYVLKVHELLFADGWPVLSPFEANGTDSLAAGLSAGEIAGDWGYFSFGGSSGEYGAPARDGKVSFTEERPQDGDLVFSASGALTGLVYDPATAECTLRLGSAECKGRLLWQDLEGTNLRTLAFSAASSGRTYRTCWGYRYPDARSTARYAASRGYALPAALGKDVSAALSFDLWNGASLFYTSANGTFKVTANGDTMYESPLKGTKNLAEYDEVAFRRFLPALVRGDLRISFDFNDLDERDEILEGEDFRIKLSALERKRNGIWESVFSAAADGDPSAFRGSGRATIVFCEDGTLEFFRDGELKFSYAAETSFAGDVCKRAVKAFTEGSVSAKCFMANVVISDGGTPDPDPMSEETRDVFEIGGEKYTVVWQQETRAENANTGWWEGGFGAMTLEAGDCGLRYRYSRAHDRTDNALVLQDPAGRRGVFYPFGSLGEFEDGWQKDGEAAYFLDGKPFDGSGLKTGAQTPSEAGFWHGDFTVAVFRCGGALFVVCKFERWTGGKIAAVYTFEGVTSPLLVQFSGYSADMVGVVALSKSVMHGETPAGGSKEVQAFREAVAALSSMETAREKLAGIRSALLRYAELSDGERRETAEEFAALTAVIGEYNRAAEKVNGAYEALSGGGE